MCFGYANVYSCFIIIICISYVHTIKNVNSNVKINLSDSNSDIYLNSLQFIAKYGYTPEKYVVVTRDGYLVDVLRIRNTGPPVLLVHGIGDSSDSWLLLGPGRSLALLLSDLGYDVWMFNARGNKYSRGHIKNLTSKEYWNFSYEEMGTEDLPAVVDLILRITSRRKLSYVGFSQGTTIFLVMCSMRPEYNNKIKKAILLAPVAWINHIKYPFIDILSNNLNVLKSVFDSVGVYDIYADNMLKNLYHAKVCQKGVPEQILCKLEFYISYGIKNISNIYEKKLPVLASHIPSGVSTKTFVHYFQSYLSKNFQRYDYGPKKNQIVYSSNIPPGYNLSLVTVPLYIYNSEADWFSTSKDVDILRNKLSNVVQFIKFNASLDFTHLEFVYGSRTNTFINKNIVRILGDHS